MRLSSALPWIGNALVIGTAIVSAKHEKERWASTLAELPQTFRDDVLTAVVNAQPSHREILVGLAQLVDDRGYAASAAVIRERIAEVEKET